MPKETEEEKAEKARVMEIVLKDACSVPMEIMEKCCEAIELIVEFGANGSKPVSYTHLAAADLAAGSDAVILRQPEAVAAISRMIKALA